ncbi:xanthine dehydrogenase family protein molybdopterin-binding subunit [Chloroflexota bacterium]
MSQEYSVVGKSVPRVDAIEKVTGKARYAADFKMPGLCYAKLLSSPYPHARILHIDTSRAEKLLGVRAMVTGQDTLNTMCGGLYIDQYIIARDVVRCVGEPVAAVVAETEDIARDAVELIDVDYEVLPAVFDMEEAMKPDCPVNIHPDVLQYLRIPNPRDRWHACPEGRHNVFQYWQGIAGDVEKGFKEADLIVENKFYTPRANIASIETHVADAWLEPDGGVTLRLKKQTLHIPKMAISKAFGIPLSKVRFIVPYVGGGFGTTDAEWPESIAVMLAIRSRRPVRLIFDRTEQFAVTPNKPARITYIKDGLKRDGTIIAREIKCISDYGAYSGAYNTYMFVAASMGGAYALYRIPNFKGQSYGVYTNLFPCSAFRGVGNPEMQWAIEQQMDIIADKVVMDPVELRRKHILKEGERQCLGQVTHSIGAEECMDKVAQWLEWDKPPEVNTGPWRRGKGISLCSHFSPTDMPSNATVKIHIDGTIEVRHSACEIGQGCDTVLSQIAAEEFGTSMEQIKIVARDTAFTPFEYMTAASRITFNAGNSVIQACRDAKRQLFELAAPRLEVSPESLETKKGRVYLKENPEKSINISDLFLPMGFADVLGGEIVGRGTFHYLGVLPDMETGQSEKLWAFHCYGSHAVQVAVNVDTGEVKVEKAGACIDMGQPINPKMCEQQIEGGIGQGIGHSIYEETVLEEGMVVNPSFVDYKLPTMMEMPDGKNIQALITAAPHNDGPYKAKGFGEGALAPFYAALGNAFCNATGVRIKDMPLTREKVLKALKEKR